MTRLRLSRWWNTRKWIFRLPLWTGWSINGNWKSSATANLRGTHFTGWLAFAGWFDFERGINMHTISDIVTDVNRHCMVNNMVEDRFSYRLVYFINTGKRSEKHHIDTQYKDLRSALENIVRGNLTATNTVVVAAVTALKDGKCVCLLSRSYGFNLSEYFRQLTGRKKEGNKNRNIMYG